MFKVLNAVMKHHDQKEVGKERGYLVYFSIAHSSSLSKVRQEQGRRWCRGNGWELLTDLLCLLSYRTPTTNPGMAPRIMGWTLPYQLLIRKTLYGFAFLILQRVFVCLFCFVLLRVLFFVFFSLSNDFSLCQVDLKLAKTFSLSYFVYIDSLWFVKSELKHKNV